MTRLLISVTLFTLLSACATNKVQSFYDGDASTAALIQSSPTVQVKYVDNDETATSFVGQQATYKVAAGQHTLMVEYSDLFNLSTDEHEKVVSRPAKVTFTAEAGKTYQLVNPKQSTVAEAKEFAENPSFSVQDVQSGAMVEAVVELSRPRTFLTELRSAVTPVYEFDSDQVQHTAPITSGSPMLEVLQSAWKNASEADREAFRNWITQ